jgi:hypothetical protein
MKAKLLMDASFIVGKKFRLIENAASANEYRLLGKGHKSSCEFKLTK